VRIRLVLLATLVLAVFACNRVEVRFDPGESPEAATAQAERSPANPARGDAASPWRSAGRKKPAAAPGAGEAARVYYQFVDASGSVRFVDRLDKVPAELRERAGRIEMKDKEKSEPSRARKSPTRRSRRPFAASASMPLPQRPEADVVVYTTKWCGWCRKTLAHLDRKRVDYVNKDIEDDPDAARELRRKTGSTAIPVLEIDGELVRGFDTRRIDQLLARAG
jgi:glutaredoxin